MSGPRTRPRRQLQRTAAVTGLALATLGGALVPAALAANPVPAQPAPAVVEGPSPYLGQNSCDPTAKPGTVALKDLLISSYGGGSLGIVRSCGIGGASEHKEGRAFDWALSVASTADKARAAQFLTWLTANGPDGQPGYNARRLGVMYAIWNRQVWSIYNASAGWRPYTGADPHTNHMHISLSWSGALKRTSFWTGTAAPVDYGPCRTYLHFDAPKYTVARLTPCAPAKDPLALTGSPTVALGSTGAYVYQLQSLLRVTADGRFGTGTKTALAAFQAAHTLPAVGVTDPATWAALRLAAAPKPAPVPPPPPLPPAPVDPAALVAPYVDTTVSSGATGAAVVALQTVLRIPADGAFGPQTAAAVLAFKTAHSLTADSIVDPPVWALLALPVAVATPAPLPPPKAVPVPKPVPTPVPKPVPAKVSPLTKYARTTLKKGSHGAAVSALQRALHVRADGRFGPRTRIAVLAFERRRHLHVDGVVTGRDWKALGA
jgi:peptidoglycan hydrolase-like protein with peptidoglycan-binding domain